MEELVLALLDVVIDDFLIDTADFVLLGELLTEFQVTAAELEDVFRIVESVDSFKQWLAAAFDLTKDTVNAVLGLQMLYKMVDGHYQASNAQSQAIDVFAALQDMEATLKQNFAQIVSLAKAEEKTSAFSQLPADTQAAIRDAASEEPMQYWLASKMQILHALEKIPIYAGN